MCVWFIKTVALHFVVFHHQTNRKLDVRARVQVLHILIERINSFFVRSPSQRFGA